LSTDFVIAIVVIIVVVALVGVYNGTRGDVGYVELE
jgi:hypothetical protein